MKISLTVAMYVILSSSSYIHIQRISTCEYVCTAKRSEEMEILLQTPFFFLSLSAPPRMESFSLSQHIFSRSASLALRPKGYTYVYAEKVREEEERATKLLIEFQNRERL
jgi:hypothetical protein